MKLLKAASLTLPPALGLSAAANPLHMLSIRRDHTERRHHDD